MAEQGPVLNNSILKSNIQVKNWAFMAGLLFTGACSPGSGNSMPLADTATAECEVEFPVSYDLAGLPLLQSNPGAPIALYLDFDGGTYHSASRKKYFDYGPYDRDNNPANFSLEEQEEIRLAWQRVSLYFAMFDVNVTTDDRVRRETGKWGWILISNDVSGGRGSKSRTAIGTDPYARSYVGSSTAHKDNHDKSRRIAHELGHNFTLEHAGVWDKGKFYKWEDWPEWDREYGPIMGGGGKGRRNGWGHGHYSKHQVKMQNAMKTIRQRIVDVGNSVSGWRKDDFPDSQVFPLCTSDEGSYRMAILGSPGDVDQFRLDWSGGDLYIDASPVDVSAALPAVTLLKGQRIVGKNSFYPDLPPGRYTLYVTSTGEYGALGKYSLKVNR